MWTCKTLWWSEQRATGGDKPRPPKFYSLCCSHFQPVDQTDSQQRPCCSSTPEGVLFTLYLLAGSCHWLLFSKELLLLTETEEVKTVFDKTGEWLHAWPSKKKQPNTGPCFEKNNSKCLSELLIHQKLLNPTLMLCSYTIPCCSFGPLEKSIQPLSFGQLLQCM